MAVLIDEGTRLVVQGITGKEGAFHALRNRSYGTNAEEGRRILEAAANPAIVPAATMLEAARKAVELAHAGQEVG